LQGPVLHFAPITVFISHSSHDVETATALIRLIESALKIPAREIRCTSVDGYRLPVGADTATRLRLETVDSKALIGLITPSSLRSGYVLFELGARWGAAKFLAPVLGNGASTSDLEAPLSGLNALQLTQKSQVMQLVEDLGRHLGIPLEPQSLFHDAIETLVQVAARATPVAKSSPDTSELEPQALAVLKHLADRPRLHVEDISVKFSLQIEKAQYYLDQLEARHLIEYIASSREGIRYFLSAAGRSALVSRGLL
jgi:hypothetical protein